MNDLLAKGGPATRADVRGLNGRIVLVKSNRDHRNPPSAMRGTIEVRAARGSEPVVSIAIEFPQMFTKPAHHRTIPIDDAALARLLASERNGTFEFAIDDELVSSGNERMDAGLPREPRREMPGRIH